MIDPTVKKQLARLIAMLDTGLDFPIATERHDQMADETLKFINTRWLTPRTQAEFKLEAMEDVNNPYNVKLPAYKIRPLNPHGVTTEDWEVIQKAPIKENIERVDVYQTPTSDIAGKFVNSRDVHFHTTSPDGWNENVAAAFTKPNPRKTPDYVISVNGEKYDITFCPLEEPNNTSPRLSGDAESKVISYGYQKLTLIRADDQLHKDGDTDIVGCPICWVVVHGIVQDRKLVVNHKCFGRD